MAIGYDWTELNSYTVTISGFTGRFSLWVKLNSQNIANNTSNVTFQWYLQTQMGYATSDNARDYVSGAGWNDSQRRTYQGDMVLREWTGDIAHESDGTKSYTAYGRTEMVSINVDTDWVAGYFELPTIARASVPTNSPATLNIIDTDNTLTVRTNRQSSSFTHTIRISCGSWSSTKTGVGASTTFNIPYSEIGNLGSGDTATLTTTCTTYNGSTNLGTKTCTSTLRLYRISTPSNSPATLSIINTSNTLTVSISRTTSTFTHAVKVSCGSWSATKTGVGTSTTFNIPHSAIDQFETTGTTATIKTTCTTYNGDNKLGSKTTTSTLRLYRISSPTNSPSTLNIIDSSNTLTVSTNRTTTSFTHTIKVSCGSWSSTKTGVGASTTFAIPHSAIDQFGTTGTTATLTTTCTTYNGSNSLGSKTTTSTLRLFRISSPTNSPSTLSINNTSNTLTVSTNRSTSSYTHTIKVESGSWSSTQTGVGTSTTFNLPYSSISSFGTTIKTTCTTYYNGTSLGSKNTTSTLKKYAISTPTVSPSTLTIKNATNTLTVTTNRSTTSYTHVVKVTCGSWSLTNSNVGASTTFSVPYSVIAQFASTSKTATATVQCTTYNGSNSLGSKSATVTFQIDKDTDHPNVGTISISDTNTKTSSVVSSGQMVKGASNLVASIPLTVSGSYTQLSSATVTCGDTTQTYSLSGTSQTISFTSEKIGVASLKVTVKDRRGTSASRTRTWTLLDYNPVTVTASATRPSATEDVINITAKGTVFGGTYGSSTNTYTISYRWKRHSASSWTTGARTYTYTPSSGKVSYSRTFTPSESFAYTAAYDIRVTVEDLFTSATYTFRLAQGLPIISWDETEACVYGTLDVHDREYPERYWTFPNSLEVMLTYGGVRNLCPRFAGTTRNGLTFTVNSTTGRVTVSGTSTDDTSWANRFVWSRATQNCYFSGCADTGSATTWRTYIYDQTEGARAVQWDGSTAVANCYTASALQQVRMIQGHEYSYTILFSSGITASNLIFEPMITNYRMPSTTYSSYAWTNVELFNLLQGMLQTQAFSGSSLTLSAGAGQQVAIAITAPSGYVPLAVCRTWTTGSALMTQCSTTTQPTTTSVNVYVRNVTTSSATVTPRVEVLFIREEFA